jgi:transposase
MKKIIIGIDFSKETFDATLLDCRRSELSQAPALHGQFENRGAGFRACLSWVEKCVGPVPAEDLLFCGEKTGKYSLRMSNFLYVGGYCMWLESGLRIKLSLGISRGKSDKADSLKIARYAYRYQDGEVCYEPPSENLSRLRELFMFRQKLVSMKKGMDVRRNLTEEFGDCLGDVGFVVESSGRIVEAMKQEIAACEKEMRELISEDPDIRTTYTSITSIRGVALINAVAFITYTDNFREFGGNARKIATYWGVAAFARESGTSVRHKAKVSKMASKMLKALITQAAESAVRWEPKFRDYFKSLQARGKAYGVALNNVKNKLIHVITALAISRQTYDPVYQRPNSYVK